MSTYKDCVEYLWGLRAENLDFPDIVEGGTPRWSGQQFPEHQPDILQNEQEVAKYMMNPGKYASALTIYASFHGEKQSNTSYTRRKSAQGFVFSKYRPCMTQLQARPPPAERDPQIEEWRDKIILSNHPKHPAIFIVPKGVAILIFNKECELGSTDPDTEINIREALRSNYLSGGDNIFKSKWSMDPPPIPGRHGDSEYTEFNKTLLGNGQLYMKGDYVPSYILQADFSGLMSDKTFYVGAEGPGWSSRAVPDYIKQLRQAHFDNLARDAAAMPTGDARTQLLFELGRARFHGAEGAAAYSGEISLSSFVNFISSKHPDKPILFVFFHCDPKISSIGGMRKWFMGNGYADEGLLEELRKISLIGYMKFRKMLRLGAETLDEPVFKDTVFTEESFGIDHPNNECRGLQSWQGWLDKFDPETRGRAVTVGMINTLFEKSFLPKKEDMDTAARDAGSKSTSPSLSDSTSSDSDDLSSSDEGDGMYKSIIYTTTQRDLQILQNVYANKSNCLCKYEGVAGGGAAAHKHKKQRRRSKTRSRRSKTRRGHRKTRRRRSKTGRRRGRCSTRRKKKRNFRK